MSAAAIYIRDPKSNEEKLLGPLDREVAIGKNPEVGLRLDDLRCDGIHALIERNDKNEYTLIDLGSQFGTFVKGKRIQLTSLKPGDDFVIGTHHLVLRDRVNTEDRVKSSDTGRLLDVSKRRDVAPPALATEKEVLQVSLHWGEQLLEQRTFTVGEEITIGTQRDATFGLTLNDSKLSRKSFPIAKYKRGGLRLHIPAEAMGLVWIGNDALSIDYLRHKDKSNEDFGEIKLQLRLGDRADIQFGELTLSFRFIVPAEKMPVQIIPAIDKIFFKIGAGMLGLFALFSIWLFTNKVQLPETTLEDVPKNLKRAVYDAGIANALKRRQAAIGALAKSQQGGRAGGEEGKASPSREREPKHAKANNKRTSKKQQRMVKAKSGKTRYSVAESKGKPAEKVEPTVDLNSAFAPSTKSNSAVGPISALPGQQQAGNTIAALTDPGSFARGRKGNGGGGGGKSVGIGDLSGYGEGGGMGAGDYGILPSKGHDIAATDTEEIMILGGLDRDVIASIIRRYLAQIQYCYEKQLVANPKLRGKVTVGFVIAGGGSVQSAEVVESSLRNEATEQCITSKIMTWKFPKPRGGGTVGVKYPFILMSNSGG